MFVPDPEKGSWSYEIVEQPGAAPYFTYLMESYLRTDAGVGPAHFFRVTPARPMAKLRERALKLSPPQDEYWAARLNCPSEQVLGGEFEGLPMV